MFLIAMIACGGGTSKGTKSSDFTTSSSDTAACDPVSGPGEVAVLGPMTCDGDWFALSLLLDRVPGTAEMLLLRGGSEALVEPHFISGLADPCGHWFHGYTQLQTETTYLRGNRTTFTCSELMDDVTLVAWFAESFPPPVSDCVAWGPEATEVIAGEWDAIVGDQGPLGGFSDCRIMEPLVPGAGTRSRPSAR